MIRLPILGAASTPAKLAVGLVALLTTAGAVYLGTPGNSAAGNAKPSLALQVAPASQTVTRGQSVTYAVTVAGVNGFTGAVTLAASGLPAGATASFSPSPVTVGTAAAGSTLTVHTTATTTLGAATFTITGTGSKVSSSVQAGLSVNAVLTSSLALAATPSTVTMAPGAIAVYTLQLTRRNLTAPVSLAVAGGLPAGATAGFTPNPVTGDTATLQLATPATAEDGTYQLYLVATGRDPQGQLQAAYANVQLTLRTTGKAFTIAGNLAGQLSPGATLPLDLSLTNPNKKQISITNLTVTISGVVRTPAMIAANKPCTVADYAVTQYAGGYPLTVPGSATASLSQLSVPAAAMPHILMRDTTSNQDGCKGATVNLAYSGSGQGS
ncbi:MAG TPA: hypothetical protein VFU36_10945 [Jatrophihabitans sp.]|nr:hypothetical protein [Jatrophihabitans sp.]